MSRVTGVKVNFSTTAMDYQRLFEDNLRLIEGVVSFVCRRHGLWGDEADNFRSYVFFKLIDRDYRVFRKFRGTASLRTYLVTVTTRLCYDYRTERWGKWRPSKAAERLGATALLLERLRHRDGHSLRETIEIMRLNHGVQESPEALTNLAARLPERISHREEPEDALANLPHSSPGPDETLVAAEEEESRREIVAKLRLALKGLDCEDRLIVRMRYDRGLGVAEIARALGVEQKPLYRRFDHILDRLRSELKRNGVSETETRRLFVELVGM